MMMMYDAKAIANEFLDLAKAAGEDLTPMKLQKLVYYAHGWHLALRDRPLLNEQVEAWAYGPVIPSLYQEFKRFGDGAITDPAMAIEWTDQDDPGQVRYPKVEGGPDPEWTKRLLKRVWDGYRDFSAIQLSKLTHEVGTPWDTVWKKYHGELPRGTDIPPEVIRDYFLDLIREKAAAVS